MVKIWAVPILAVPLRMKSTYLRECSPRSSFFRFLLGRQPLPPLDQDALEELMEDFPEDWRRWLHRSLNPSQARSGASGQGPGGRP